MVLLLFGLSLGFGLGLSLSLSLSLSISLFLLLASLSQLSIEGEAGNQTAVLLLMHVMEHGVILMLLFLKKLLVLVLELLLLGLPSLVLSVRGEIRLGVDKVVVVGVMAVTTISHLFLAQLELTFGSLPLQLLLVSHQAVLIIGWCSWALALLNDLWFFRRLNCPHRLSRLQTERLLLLGSLSSLFGTDVGWHHLSESLGHLFPLEGSLALLLQVSFLVLQVPYISFKLPDAPLIFLDQLLLTLNLSACLQRGKLFCLSPLLFKFTLAFGFLFRFFVVVIRAMAPAFRSILESLRL